jgi:hypothetical protein
MKGNVIFFCIWNKDLTITKQIKIDHANNAQLVYSVISFYGDKEQEIKG